MSQQRLTESPEIAKQRIARREVTAEAARSSHGGSLSPLLQLQRTLGNQRVAQLIQAKRLTPQGKILNLQPKLTVGAADDQYEQEADRVARHVVSMPESVALAALQPAPPTKDNAGHQNSLQSKPLPLATSITPFVQRTAHKANDREEEQEQDKPNEVVQARRVSDPVFSPLQRQEASKKEGDEPVQAKHLTGSSSETLQRQAAAQEEERDSIQTKSTASLAGSFDAGEEVESRLSQSKGGGSPLPDPVRAFMEPRFGVDFSHVRVHTGIHAIQMNRAVAAQAFTHGADIYYGAGSSPTNLDLTAHELTHVIQQTGSTPLQMKRRKEKAAPRGLEFSIQRICAACAEDYKEKRRAAPVSSHEQLKPKLSLVMEPASIASNVVASALQGTRPQVSHSKSLAAPIHPGHMDAPRDEVDPHPERQLDNSMEPTTSEGFSRPLSDAPLAPDRSQDTQATAVPTGELASAPDTELKAQVTAQARLIDMDTRRSEAEVSNLGSADRQRISAQFGSARQGLSGFFARSADGIQSLIANKQREISTTSAAVLESIRGVAASTQQAAQEQANQAREGISEHIENASISIDGKVRGIADQIVGVISTVSLPNIPGVAQLRNMAVNFLKGAAGTVTGALSRVVRLLGDALRSGMSLLNSLLGAVGQLVDRALSAASSAIQRLVQQVFQALSRLATVIVSGLQRALTASITPMINRLEGSILQALTKAQQQTVAALRSNREPHLATLASLVQSKPGSAAAKGPAQAPKTPQQIGQDAVQNNRMIAQTFREKTSGTIGSIFQLMTAMVERVVGRFTGVVASIVHAVESSFAKVIQALYQVVHAVGDFTRSLIEAVRNGLNGIVNSVRSLIQAPIDQVFQFAQGAWSRIRHAVGGLVQNFISGGAGILSSISVAIGEFIMPSGPITKPRPPGGPITLPSLERILLAFLVVGAIVVADVVAALVALGLSQGAALVVVGIAAIVVLLLALALLYLLFRWLLKPSPTPPRPPKPEKITSRTVAKSPGARTRTTIGTGENVMLKYSGGSTTWTTTGGKLNRTTGANVVLSASDTAQSITVTAGSATIIFVVVAPSGVFMDRRGAMQHDQGYPNSGIRIRPYILPDSVNFYNIVYHEMDVNGVATPGEYSCNPFRAGHCRAGGGGVPCPDINVTDNVVSGKGTETDQDDCAYSGWCTNTPPFSPGSVSLSIPHEYKVGGGSAHPFAPVSQVHTVEADGNTLTTTKDGENGKTTVNAGSSSNGC